MKLDIKITLQQNYKSQIYIVWKEYERIQKYTKIFRIKFMFFVFCHCETYTNWFHVYICNICTCIWYILCIIYTCIYISIYIYIYHTDIHIYL